MKQKMKSTVRQMLALVLCVAMLLPMLPAFAFATETGEAPSEDVTVSETVTVETEAPAAEEPTGEPAAEEPREDTSADLPADVTSSDDGVMTLAAGELSMGTVNLPAYPGGNISNLLTLDCGYSTQNNGQNGNEYKSYVRIVTGTSQTHFDSYRQSLKSAGYNEVSYHETQNGTKTNNKNCFAKFIASNGSHSVYFYRVDNYGKYDGSDTSNPTNHEHCNEARIIVDTNPDTVRAFSYEAQSGGDGKSELYMYGITMSDNGWDMYNEPDKTTQQRRNCGQLIVMKMPDNSLFINDGGNIEQFNDEKTCKAFLDFCREITGVPEGQKMVINTWFITHSHRDHYSGFPVFLSKYSDQFDLKNIMYNFEDNYGGDLHTGSHLFIQKVAQLYPDAKYYKLHTGEQFNIAGVEVDVLFTMEERLKYSTPTDGKYISTNFNDTSAVLMMKFDGVKFLLTGDLGQLDNRLISMYPASDLKADILQVPHHGFDSNHLALCQTVAPTYTFFTQNENAVNSRLKSNYDAIKDYLGTVYFGGSETVGLAVKTTATAAENGSSTYAANGGTLTQIYSAPVVTAEYTPVVDGVYIIKSALDLNKEVAIKDDAAANGTNVHLWTPAIQQPTSHMFILRSQGDGTYTIQSLLTGKFLDPTTTKNAQATIWEGLSYDSSNPDSNHRRWKFQQNGDGTVSIISAATDANKDQYLDLNGGKTDNGTIIQTWTGNNTAAQRWVLDRQTLLADGVYDIITELDSSGNYDLNVNANESAVISNTQTRRNWTIQACDDDFYYVRDVVTGKYLSVNDSGDVVIDSTDPEKWSIIQNKDDRDNKGRTGTWGLVSYSTNKYLDVNGAELTDMHNVHSFQGNLTKVQLWDFTKKADLPQISYSGSKVGYVIAGCSGAAKVSAIQDGKFVDLPVTVTKTLSTGGNNPTTTKTTSTTVVTMDMLAKNGVKPDTSAKAKYVGVTLTCENQILCEDFTLYVLEVDSASVSPNSGSVPLNADASAKVEVLQEDGTFDDCTLTVTLTGTDGDVMTLTTPVSVGMLTNANGTPVDTNTEGVKSGLTLTYDGKVVCTDFELTVTGEGFDYPKYPEEGSVQVDKKGTAVGSFKETGLANIQLSATGIPLTKGTDLIIMLDMSGSMSGNNDITTAGGTKISRIDALKIALKDMMATLKTNNADVRVAMADFGDLDHFEFPDAVRDATKREEWSNPAYNDLNYVFDNGDVGAHAFGRWWGTKETVGTHEPTIYTGNHSVDAGAFENLNAHDENYWNTMVDNLHQGDFYLWETNYDRAMEYIYQLGYAIRQDNIQKAQDRELVVIFMSDGGAWQYNYFSGTSSQGNQENFTSAWSDWLTGNITSLQYNPASGGVNHTVSGSYTHGTQSPYGYFYNPKGQNWLAEAIKGDPNQLYPVVNKYAFRDDGTSPCIIDDVAYDYYYGDVRNHYTGYLDAYYGTGTTERKNYDAHNYDHAYMAAFRGLGAKMYTLGFAFINDGAMSVDVMDSVMTSISSGKNYFYKANSQDQLNACFSSISSSLVPAATQAYFTDTMGTEYDLWLGDAITGVTYKEGKTDSHQNITPTIKVMDYALDANHNRTGNPTVLETVTVENGIVISDQVFDASGKTHPNILGDDGVIRAKYFYYNTSKTNSVSLSFEGDSRTFTLAPETFFWIVGTVGTTERVLEYQVYLTGSMEGARENGVYETNTDATLHYTNYQGNDCDKKTTPPAFPWPDNLAGYRFYLVDENGTPLDSKGNESTFLDSEKLTELVYEELKQNNSVIFKAKDLFEKLDLSEDYELYDPDAVYTVSTDGDTGSWTITKGEGKNATTYVTNYGGSPTTATSSDHQSGVEYDRTVVWFAVKEKVEARPDTVVIDYGIPVDINVLANDKLGGDATVQGVRKASDETAAYAANADGDFGKMTVIAKKDNGKGKQLEYVLNSMQMPREDVFSYEAKHGNRSYYSTVTVIPATTIYYEDSFVTFKSYDYATDAKIDSTWTVVGDTQDKVQDEDRPGSGSLSQIDADNLYGTDSAYSEMSTYSLGSAHKVTVKGTTDAKNNVVSGEYATAEFTFCGTGFDVISLTSDKTGTISVKVLDEAGNKVKYVMVDTYYGYKHDAENNKWVVDTTASDTLYQVPVIKVNGLDYGRYTVKITASYLPIYDHGQDGITDTAGRENSYDFYLDAIRIYDPANDGGGNQTIENAYKADKEGWPEYFELRNLIISKKDFDARTDSSNGIIFIDNSNGSSEGYSIDDYKNYGPNNELYLAKNQAVAFNLNVPGDVASIQIAMKTVGSGNSHAKVFATDNTGCIDQDIKTATDLYYNITTLNGKTVVITNTGDAILSITNVKVTYNSALEDSIENSYFTTTPTGAQAAVMSLRSMAPVDPEPTEPEETVPETTAPEETVPETTAPEETVPETTEPEETEPTAPAETEPEEPEQFQPERFEVKISSTSVKVGSKVTVTVTTSKDVDSITINGETVTGYSSSKRGAVRTWKVKLTADTVGELPISVTAFRADGLASQPVVRTVTVTEKYTSIGNWLENSLLDLIGKLLGKNG